MRIRFIDRRIISKPLISLVFSNLIQDFVNFNNVILNANPKDPQATAKVEEVAKNLRHVALRDASYLAYMGA